MLYLKHVLSCYKRDSVNFDCLHCGGGALDAVCGRLKDCGVTGLA